MREKELRLALVCYGGVSLAVYMHGITKEVWKLLRASRAAHGGGADSLSDSERVYLDLLKLVGEHVRLRVLVDIVAGASAGGINGIFLAHAIAGGHDMEPLRALWLENADVERLIDPKAAPASRWSKVYAQPLVWLAGARRSEVVDEIVDASAREEVRQKLSHFFRSRWFEPPFSGIGFTRLIYDALLAMEAGEPGPPLLPPGQPLDLFVTVTDFHGHPERLRLHSPAEIVETEHRVVIDFRDHGDRLPRRLGHRAELTFAARATASFPGAFPPFQVGELDQVLAERGHDWPTREAFLARAFPRRASIGHAGTALIDGSVLNNAPFGPAIEALRDRPAHREVDRRFVYIDPKPGGMAFGLPSDNRPPGFFTTILRSLSDIPREQPIRDNLEAIDALSRRVRRLRYVVEGMRPAVDAAIERAMGRSLIFYRLTPARLSNWRSRVQIAAAQEAGYAYAAYAQLKLSQVVESLAETLITVGKHGDKSGGVERVRQSIWAWVRGQQIDATAGLPAERSGKTPYVQFLRRFDLLFRIRRLRFVIRRLTELAIDPPKGQDRRALDDLKGALYQILAPLLERRQAHFITPAVARLAEAADSDPAPAIDHLGEDLDLTMLDSRTDEKLVALLLGPRIGAPARRALLLAYLGFPFYDIATLPILQGEGLDEFDEIKVDRLSPDDARAIREGGAAATLKGIQFNAFGAFFSRAYRENDYLWGRLHGADRLIDIVLSSLPPDRTLPPGAAHKLKTRAFRAILDAEREHLGAIQELIASLDREVD